MKEIESTGLGIRAFAVGLIVLGLASIVTNGAAVALAREVGGIQATLAVAYGIAGIVAGSLLWRRAGGARRAYLAWCATIGFYLLTFPELLVWYSVPAFVVAVLLLGWGYRYISHNVESESFLGRRSDVG